jgi:hypothetical protein
MEKKIDISFFFFLKWGVFSAFDGVGFFEMEKR